MIEIRGLSKSYGRLRVLHEIDLEVAPGTTVGLWGPNGAGKTTMLLCLLGVLSHRGTVRVGGHDLSEAGPSARSLIGYAPQAPTFPYDLTVLQVLQLSAALRGVPSRRVDSAAEYHQLSRVATTQVAALSGGMRQRLALAVALLGDPAVLLLDEPFANLDAAFRHGTVELLDGLRADGRTILITSHDPTEVAMLASRVVVMEAGRITGECAPAELGPKLGLDSWLHLIIDPSDLPATTAVLASLGHRSRSNGHGVLVEIQPHQTAAVVVALHEAGIAVDGVEVWR